MRMLSKLLGMWILGKTVSSTTPLFLRLITAMAAIAALAALSVLVFAILMVGGVWAIYTQLIAYDYTQGEASALIACGLVAILLALVVAVQRYTARVRTTLRQLAYVQAPVSSRLSHIFDEFARGYNTTRKRRAAH